MRQGTKAGADPHCKLRGKKSPMLQSALKNENHCSANTAVPPGYGFRKKLKD
jgi:hypothetical protein